MKKPEPYASVIITDLFSVENITLGPNTISNARCI